MPSNNSLLSITYWLSIGNIIWAMPRYSKNIILKNIYFNIEYIFLKKIYLEKFIYVKRYILY